MHIASRLSPLPVVALPLALCLLLAATLQLHLPLMLWDHIDLVPIYDAWQRGALAASQFWRIHDGSHFHSAAYAVLLATTWLSGGRPWLDCVAGWAFYALGALALFHYRSRRPLPVGPYRVPGYPWTPLLFALSAAGIVLSTLLTQPGRAAVGIGLVLLGAPAYWVWRRSAQVAGAAMRAIPAEPPGPPAR